MSISRRSLLRGGFAAAAGVGLAGGLSGCGSPLSAGLAGSELAPGTLTSWNLFSGGDGERMKQMEDVYRASLERGGALQTATFAWGNPYYTKVSLATLGDAPPDVAAGHLTRTANLAQAGLLTEITDDLLTLGDLSPGSFNEKAWQAQQVDGRNYAIPLDTHPFVLFYNKTVCEEAGLLDPDGSLRAINGLEEWTAALQAAKEVTGAFGASTATVADPSTSWRWFNTLYSQREGNTPWLEDDGRRLSYDEDLTLQTLTDIQKMTADGLMPKATDYAGSQTLMFTGQAAFYLQGEWEITTAQSIEGLEFGMTPIPTLYDRPAAHADSHAFVLPRFDRSEDQARRVMQFIRTMLEESQTWAEGGHVPAYLPVADSEAYAGLTPQSDYAAAADNPALDAIAWYSGSGSNFENVVGAQIGLVQQGLATPEQALGSIRSQLLTYSRTKSPLT